MNKILLALFALLGFPLSSLALKVEVVGTDVLIQASICGEARVVVGDSFYPSSTLKLGEANLAYSPGLIPPPSNNFLFQSGVPTPVKVTWDGNNIVQSVGTLGNMITLTLPIMSMSFTELYVSVHSVNLFNDGEVKITQLKLDGIGLVSSMFARGVNDVVVKISEWAPGASHTLEYMDTFDAGTGPQYPFNTSLESRVSFVGVPEQHIALSLICGVLVLVSPRKRQQIVPHLSR